MDPWSHSIAEMSFWRGLSTELGFHIEALQSNPIDDLWREVRPPEQKTVIADYPIRFAGISREEKCAAIADHARVAGLQALLIADPEDVSWLLNARVSGDGLQSEVGDWHVVPCARSRAIVRSDGRVTWFVDETCLEPEVLGGRGENLTIAPPGALAATLKEEARRGLIGADLRRTPEALGNMLGGVGNIRDDDVLARRRWRKNEIELQAARNVHRVDAVAVVRFMAWLAGAVRNREVSEFEAAEVLESFRSEHAEYRGASMPLMSASGASGAQPHYVPRRQGSRVLNEHPIYWMDSGGHYPGGTTDNTITLSVGNPETKHIFAHTVVLQGFISLATARVPVGTAAIRLDVFARQALWRHGMDFEHGTGHGVGNFLNIHEGPVLSRDPSAATLAPVEPGMILTNEPGYYVPGDFGLRIESHMVVVPSPFPGFVEFETISRLPIDPQLVDFDQLLPAERGWLARYHREVLHDLEPRLDRHSAGWLRTLVQNFTDRE
jgi:Xaa-Pro aminopeptidase